MKTFASILVAAAVVAVATASCPNQCSGHGACTTDDQCRCWKGYEGYDCSQRACPYVESWGKDSHGYAECAGKGICDRTSGLCACFSGYEGRGCERSACSNGCSGNGVCRMIADLSSSSVGAAYTWDEKAITACVCDGGFTGPDCSQRMCPYGDDPMTVCEQGNTEQVQKVSFKMENKDGFATSTSVVMQNNQFALRFKSWADEMLYTDAVDNLFSADNTVTTTDTAAVLNDYGIPADGDNSVYANLETALEALPNARVLDVDVGGIATDDVVMTGDDLITSSYLITFKHEASGNNYGEQSMLRCPHARQLGSASTAYTFGCGAAGCQPRVFQPRALIFQNLIVAGTAFETSFVVAASAIAGVPVRPTPESVLTCPVGATDCDASSSGVANGKLSFVFGKDGNGDFHLWASAEAKPTAFDDETAASFTATDIDTFMHVTEYVSTHSLTYTYFGIVVDEDVVDISALIPDTKVVIEDSQLATLTGTNDGTIVDIFYTVAQCESPVDVTNGAVDGFNNFDIENIECSGRGECDRAAGLCSCFEGYTGDNCGRQSILV